MSGKKSKRKGNNYENVIKKKLAAWTGVEFTRTLGSGAQEVKGDVAPADDLWPFVVEAKNRESWSPKQLMEKSGPVFDWWAKVCSEAKDKGKLPMLIFTRNYHKDYVMLSKDGSDLLAEKFGLLFDFTLTPSVVVYYPSSNAVVLELDYLLGFNGSTLIEGK